MSVQPAVIDGALLHGADAIEGDAAARTAGHAWSPAPHPERTAVLARVSDVVRRNAGEHFRLEGRNTGTPPSQARVAVVEKSGSGREEVCRALRAFSRTTSVLLRVQR